MSLKLVLLSCIVALAAGKRLPRLAGGIDAKPGQFPYQVNLYYKPTIDSKDPAALGGGAILNNQWILTAAYNVRNLVPSISELAVKAGSIYLKRPSEFEQVANIATVFAHPKYEDGSDKLYDIALMKLETPLEFNEYVQPIDLPQANGHPRGSGVIAGLGSLVHMLNGCRYPEILQTLTLPVISNDECQKILDGFDNYDGKILGDDVAFCTGPTETNQGYCLYDTGNPLVTEENGKQVVSGVASFVFAAACTEPGVPSVYTRVSAFNDWIQETTNKN